MNKYEAQCYLNKVVNRMVAANYPVEAEHKLDYRKDYIPADSFVWGSSDRQDEENLARLLIGGWFSKAALIQLFIISKQVTKENFL